MVFNNKKLLGISIKHLRTINSTSQKELAKVLGVSSTLLSLIEKGERSIKPDKIKIIENYYHLDQPLLLNIENVKLFDLLVNKNDYSINMKALDTYFDGAMSSMLQTLEGVNAQHSDSDLITKSIILLAIFDTLFSEDGDPLKWMELLHVFPSQ